MDKDCDHCIKWMEHFYWTHFPQVSIRFIKRGLAAENLSQGLALPEKFLGNVRCKLHEDVELKGPSGNIWTVELGRSSTTLSGRGWVNFVSDHSIAEGDTLLFKYVGKSLFEVRIFDASECEKERSYLAKNSVEHDMRLMPRRVFTRTGTNVSMTNRSCSSDRGKTEVRGKAMTMEVPHEETPPSNGKIGGNHRDEPKNDSRVQVVQCEAHHHQFVHVKEENLNGGGNSTFQSPDAGGSCSKSSERSPNRGRSRKFNSGLNPNHPTKRTATEEETLKALLLADEFTPARPSFMLSMLPTHVIRKFVLVIPHEFASKYLPSQHKILWIQNSKRESWRVSYVREKRRMSLTRGWMEFAHANGLEQGDTCVFELASDKDNTVLDCHIFHAKFISLKVKTVSADDVGDILRLSASAWAAIVSSLNSTPLKIREHLFSYRPYEGKASTDHHVVVLTIKGERDPCLLPVLNMIFQCLQLGGVCNRY